MQYNSSQDMYEETGTDNNGNLRMEKLAHTVGTPFSVDRSFGYDTANRLTAFSEPTSAKSQTFGYDAFGNLFQTGASGVPALRPNGSSWYLMTNGSVRNRLANTAYDAAGHQTQLSLTPGTTASYDAEGRVSKIETGGSTVATYEYDGDGRRVKKSTGGSTTTFVYDAAGNLAAEYGGTVTEAGARYLTADHLGSTRLVTKQDQSIDRRIDYLPFGEFMPASVGGRTTAMKYEATETLAALTQRFTGQIRDGESTAGTDTGLDYFNARYFWATLGRLTSPDPENAGADPSSPQSWNGYSYALGNPYSYTDRSGLGPCPVDSETGDEQPCIEGLWYETFLMLERAWWHAQMEVPRKLAEYAQRPRDPGCMSQETAKGVLAGSILFGVASVATTGGTTAPVLVPAGAATGGAIFGGAGWFSCASSTGSGGGGGGGAPSGDVRKLNPGEIGKLKARGIDPELLKKEIVGARSGRYDLYKTKSGDIVIKAKGGSGEAIETGYKITGL